MNNNLKYLFALLFIVIATYDVSYSNGLSYGEGIKFEERYMMDEIINDLQENNIPYIMDDEGFITYPSKHKDKVDGIINSLKERPVMYFKSKKYADEFLGILEEKKINYEVKNAIDGEIHIFWKKEDNEQVRKLIRLHLN
jgi:hypothetical protein